MSNINLIGVVGTDGVVPIYAPNDRWCIWSMAEIWTGQTGNKRYVPKVNDYVIEPSTYTTYIVESIDNVTLIPTLREKHLNNMSAGFSETDMLLGVGPGTQADTYRVYLDTSVTPFVLAVDARLKIGGSMSNHVKLFKGANLSDNGHVVSKVYDNSGNFITENIALELAAIDSHVNYSIKVVPTCYCTEPLNDGEIITAVVYSADGHVVSKRQLLVENTAFIRGVDASVKYVSHISLECPFMSPTTDRTILFPLNVPVNSLNLVGVVHYSDGSVLRLPVDGTKFSILGINQYVSTIIGQKIKLVLSYALSTTETAYGAVSSDGKYITEGYDMMTVDANHSYTVKLFCYPTWVDENVGYRLKWFMFNLDRNISFDVTPFVHFADNTGAFDPLADGYVQRRAVYINLSDVSGIFKSYIHTQVVDVMLRTSPGSLTTPWTVSHEAAVGQTAYGLRLTARIRPTDANQILINGGASEYEDWLQRVYTDTYPLVDGMAGSTLLEPTHFEITYDTYKAEYPVSNWDSAIVLPTPATVNSTVFIKFIRRTPITDLQLCMSAMMIQAQLLS